MRDINGKHRGSSLGELSEEVLRRLAICGSVAVLTLALTVFSLLSGFGGEEIFSIQDDENYQRVAIAEFELADFIDMDAAGAVFEADMPVKMAGTEQEMGFQSAAVASTWTTYGDFYDTNIDPNAVSIITINGQRIVYMRTATDAQAVLDGIIARYTENNSRISSINFAESVEIIPADDYVTADMAAVDKTITETYLCQVDEAINYLMNGCSQPKTYTVQGGDTLWDIAIKNGMSPYQLADLNPGLNADRLSIGDVINLIEIHPFLNVTTVEVATETENIPFQTVYTESAELYKGQTQVTSYGSYGSKQREVEYIKQNGVIVSSKVLSEEVVSEPVTQYATVGTTAMPIKTGSGSLSSPVGSTKLSSAAGAFGAGRGHRRHAGVDLKANSGDPVYAADGGTVIFAGWGGGSYGNIVKISHGNGVETRYAHLATVNVSYGDNVDKGGFIGTVGKTGNATGYLVHFEVLVNGSNVNPLNYI